MRSYCYSSYCIKLNKKLIYSVCAIICMCITVNIYVQIWGQQNLKYAFRYPRLKSNIIHDSKWIVVTTSRPPSDSIKYLASIPGWKLVVVGDVHTSPSWKLENCTFLTISDQSFLPFNTRKLIPPAKSTKIIGYLYAISKVARLIYETEDGFQHINKLAGFEIENETIGMRYDGIRVYNPFRHFGQPYLRPKGFPFETVVQYGDNIDNYILSITKTPLIQHGLVNGDPDIDRSFISSSSKTSINIAFDGKAPPAIIPKGIFSPFNSKNTLFLYDALWAMVLPLMSSDSDILRGYWAQRLLWEIGGTVGFYPPNTFYNQSYKYTRNNDASKFKPSVLINFLNNWRCPVNLTFFQCVQFLSRDMADHRFWSRSDYQIIFSWLIDLQINGYREPKRQPYNIPETYINLASISYHSTGSENSNLHLKWRQKISKISTICEDSSYQTTNVKPVLISNILLIIVFNFPFYDNIPYLQLMYSVTFNNIVYCGNDIQTFITSSKKFPENVTFLEQDVYAGYFAYRCITAAMKMNYRVQGYLTIGDDVLLNSWNILKSDLPFDKFWFTEFEILYRNQDSYWPWWHKQNGRVVFNKAWEKILNIPDEVIELQPIAHKFVETLRNNTGSVQGLFYNTSDIVYIPHAYKEEIILFMDIFSSYNVFVEVTIPSVIAGLVPLQQIVKLKGQYIWGDERYKIPVHFKDDDIYIHPVKLSQLSLLGDLLCKSYFSLLIRNGTMKQS